MSDQQTVSDAVAEVTAVDQYIARAVEQDLAYVRARVGEIHTEIERLKAAAGRIVRECDAFLTGKAYDEEPF